jgi:hypothetical protein
MARVSGLVSQGLFYFLLFFCTAGLRSRRIRAETKAGKTMGGKEKRSPGLGRLGCVMYEVVDLPHQLKRNVRPTAANLVLNLDPKR